MSTVEEIEQAISKLSLPDRWELLRRFSGELQDDWELTNNTSNHEEEPYDKVSNWFIEPIRALFKIRTEHSDGAFLAMSASLAMYERFLVKVAQERKLDPEPNRAALGGEDLGIGEEKFRVFWWCFRDGLQHQFQPKKKSGGYEYYWSMSNEHSKIPEVTAYDNKKYSVKVNPWKFAELVYERYLANTTYWEKGKSHQPGTVSPLAENQQFAFGDSSYFFPSSNEPQNNSTPIYQTWKIETGNPPPLM